MPKTSKKDLWFDKAALRDAIIYSYTKEEHVGERFYLPYPPSLNSYYRYNLKTHKMYTSKEGKAYRALIKEFLSEFVQKNNTIEENIKLSIILYPPDRRKRDIDNILKVLFDALQDALLIKDDSQIMELHITKQEGVLSPGLVLMEIQKQKEKKDENIHS